MTAEVAILNREAVALAADSAVTFMGLEGRKIYNTNKLFALSMTEPIAVMVYGTGSFGPVPWETVVKEYRRQLESKQYDTVEEYASDFIQHLPSLIDSKEQYRRVFETAEWEIANIYESVKVTLLESSISAQRSSRKFICDQIIRFLAVSWSLGSGPNSCSHLSPTTSLTESLEEMCELSLLTMPR